LIGTWRLVSYETDEQSGKRGRPYARRRGPSGVRRAREHVGTGDAAGRARVELGDGGAQQVRAAYSATSRTSDVRGHGRRRERRASRAGLAEPGVGGGRQVREAALRRRASSSVRRRTCERMADTVDAFVDLGKVHPCAGCVRCAVSARLAVVRESARGAEVRGVREGARRCDRGALGVRGVLESHAHRSAEREGVVRRLWAPKRAARRRLLGACSGVPRRALGGAAISVV
jgi:hypothetical protein